MAPSEVIAVLPMSPPSVPAQSDPSKSRYPAGLSLAALGIVYGDIGTSPLYAVRECFFGDAVLEPTTENVLGVLSLVFWALVTVISVKYLLLVMRADNRGEGGILALLALLDPWRQRGRRSYQVLIVLGTFGAALLYGDAMLTPAISVLSAVEGVKVAAPTLGEAVIPLTVAILVALFAVQRRGTAKIGAVFGPIMLVWFSLLALLGLASISRAPDVLSAVNPLHAVALFERAPLGAFLLLGGVFLVVTGGEALYADMGHFGARPIRVAWFGLVLPALLLNYFGQGAYILVHPSEASHPFYNLVPAWGVYPMIGLATIVTVIASQAVISGTFSLVRQGIQLGQNPPVNVVQTSSDEIGQVYVPSMNWLLLLGTIALVIAFGSSSGLASAYGVAVSATMVITTFLLYFVMRERWKWPLPLAVFVACTLLLPDLAFFGANLFKIMDGGWFPLTVATLAFGVMATWSRGREVIRRRVAERSIPLDVLINSLALDPPSRIPGTAVFLANPGDSTPAGLLHHLKLNRVLHENVILVTAVTTDRPRVAPAQKFEAKELGEGFFRLSVSYGFMQTPNLPLALTLCRELDVLPRDICTVDAYYADRMTLIPLRANSGMSVWRKRLFAYLRKNSQRAVEFYRLPPGISVELGILVEF